MLDMALTVSVITPSYNQGSYIECTIRSVLMQDVPGLEYVVFDGGSTDETLDVLKRYDKHLRWVSEKDRGQAHEINKGLRATSGEVIGWLNSDDIYYPGAVRAACRVFETNPTVDVVYGDGYYIDESDNFILEYPTEPWDLRRLETTNYICQPVVFFHRRVVDRRGMLDERLNYCLDYEYWLRLALNGAAFAQLPRLQAGYRVYPTTKSAGSSARLVREINDMLREKLGIVHDPWISSYARVLVADTGLDDGPWLCSAAARWAVACYASLRWNRRISSSILTKPVRVVGSRALVQTASFGLRLRNGMRGRAQRTHR